MGLSRTEPTVEPLSLDEAKDQLELDTDEQDAYIQGLIVAAREDCERATVRTIPVRTCTTTLDSFPPVDRPLRLPVPPTISVTSITYVDQNGTTQTLDPSAYLVDVSGEPARISPAFGTQWPVTRNQIAAVTIVYQAGYATVPEGIKHAMKMLVRHWYENRQAASDRPTTSVPMGVDSLLSGYRWGNYG